MVRGDPEHLLNIQATYYEIFISMLIFSLVYFVYLKHKEKQNDLTKNLLIVFMCYLVAEIWLIISRLVYHPLNVELMDQFSVEGWFLYRISYYRPAFVFLSLATYYFWLFYQGIFAKEVNPKKRRNQKILIGCTILYNIFVFDVRYFFLEMITFGLISINLFQTTIPFTISALRLKKLIDDPIYKKALTSIVFMSIFFSLLILFYTIDLIVQITTGILFSIFFYIGEFCVPVAMISAYFGYIRPGSKKFTNN